MKIWKYYINGHDCEIEMPRGAMILSLQVQNSCPCIWVLVNPNNPLVKRRFVTYVTGSFADVLSCDEYISTYQNYGFVGHIFERL